MAESSGVRNVQRGKKPRENGLVTSDACNDGKADGAQTEGAHAGNAFLF